MINDAATDVLEVLHSCRCCLLRPPDKGLKTPYTHLDKTEVYWDMIQECFDIHLSLDNKECGICDVCVGRLRDARDFKLQVQRSQAALQAQRERVLRVKEEVVKSEMDENDMGVDDDSTFKEEPPAKVEISVDAMSAGDPLTLSRDCWVSVPARAAAPRAGEQLAMAYCSVKLECIRDDNTPHANPTLGHEATPAAHARGPARNDAGPGQEARGAATTHAGQDNNTCGYCGKQFTRKISLIKHKCGSKEIPNKYFATKDVSTGDKLYICDVCNKQFRIEISFKRHFRTHKGEKRFVCKICPKKFVHRTLLMEHQRIHTGIKPYVCDVCGKQFARKSYLSGHIRVHTGQKPYSCEYCLKVFRCRSGLNSHSLIHTGKKSYPCDICGKQFTQKGNLKKHISVHTGQRPFSCKYCLKAFKCKSNLADHVLIHTGIKPHSCDVCGRQFTRKDHLKTHMRVHTRDRPATGAKK